MLKQTSLVAIIIALVIGCGGTDDDQTKDNGGTGGRAQASGGSGGTSKGTGGTGGSQVSVGGTKAAGGAQTGGTGGSIDQAGKGGSGNPGGSSAAGSGGTTSAATGGSSAGSGGNAGFNASRKCGVAPLESQTPTILATDTWVTTIVADDTYIYGVGGGKNYVVKVPKAGGTMVKLYDTTINNTKNSATGSSIAIDDTSIYFLASTCCPSDTLVVKLPKDLSTPILGDIPEANIVAHLGSDVSISQVLGIDTTNIYRGGSHSSLFRMPKAGGTATSLFDTSGAGPTDPDLGMAIAFGAAIDFLITDGTWAYYITYTTYGAGLPADSPLAYGGWLLRAPLQGGDPVVVAGKKHMSNFHGNVSVANGFIYWAQTTSGTGTTYLYKKPVDNINAEPTVLASGFPEGATDPRCVSDGKNVYFLVDNDVCKVSVDGGDAVGLAYYPGVAYGARGQSPDMIVDDKNVYVLAGTNHTAIVSIPK
jgi:hypothetical protein